jgi:hypothetical protein
MDRVYSLSSRLFGYLAVTLALLAPLAVPQNAFADSASDCMAGSMSWCMTQCGMDTGCISACYAAAPGACCDLQCNGDSACQTACCQNLCNGDSTCLANCSAALTFCKPSTKCSAIKDETSCFGGSVSTNVKCPEGQVHCNCRWRALKCSCQNTSGQ